MTWTGTRSGAPLAVWALMAIPLCGQQSAGGSETLLQHAMTLHQSGDLEGAIREYRQYLAAQPDSLEAR